MLLLLPPGISLVPPVPVASQAGTAGPPLAVEGIERMELGALQGSGMENCMAAWLHRLPAVHYCWAAQHRQAVLYCSCVSGSRACVLATIIDSS
jgi:hypothetical protein